VDFSAPADSYFSLRASRFFLSRVSIEQLRCRAWYHYSNSVWLSFAHWRCVKTTEPTNKRSTLCGTLWSLLFWWRTSQGQRQSATL